MSLQFAQPPSSLERLDTALGRLVARSGFTRLVDPAAFAPGPGLAVLLLTDDPQRSPESLDVIVVLPEAIKAVGEPVQGFAADAAASPALARRFGVTRFPAVVALRDGAYLGAFNGILDWAPFVTELLRVVAAAPGRPPIAIGVAPTPSACAPLAPEDAP